MEDLKNHSETTSEIEGVFGVFEELGRRERVCPKRRRIRVRSLQVIRESTRTWMERVERREGMAGRM